MPAPVDPMPPSLAHRAEAAPMPAPRKTMARMAIAAPIRPPTTAVPSNPADRDDRRRGVRVGHRGRES